MFAYVEFGYLTLFKLKHQWDFVVWVGKSTVGPVGKLCQYMEPIMGWNLIILDLDKICFATAGGCLFPATRDIT